MSVGCEFIACIEAGEYVQASLWPYNWAAEQSEQGMDVDFKGQGDSR